MREAAIIILEPSLLANVHENHPAMSQFFLSLALSLSPPSLHKKYLNAYQEDEEEEEEVELCERNH
jgi:hypothetical protein